jgi:hypothetical protein
VNKNECGVKEYGRISNKHHIVNFIEIPKKDACSDELQAD